MPTTSDTTVLQTTARSLEIIEIIKSRNGARLGELVENLDLSKSTVHNHLGTLQDKEYVVKEGNEYHLGMKLFHLGEHAKTRKLSLEVVSEWIKDLADEVKMEVDFSIEEYGRVIVIFDEMGNQDRTGFQLGRYNFMHACASGKAILAEYSTDRVASIIDRRGLPQVTENTIGDREALFEELQTVREQGYAINDEESNDGIQAVATVITNPQDAVVGGLSIAGPTYNYPSYDQVADILLPASKRLEERIERRWQKELQPAT